MRDKIPVFERSIMKIKVCGMKYNIQEVAALQPDYLGFIFYEKSKRHFCEQEIPKLPKGIKKVGVFVNATIAFAKAKIEKHRLDIVQLHGNESLEYIHELRACLVERSRDLKVWKVFSIKDSFDFDRLKPYESSVDAFLFDTKGAKKGGNGYTFDWNVLKNHTSKTPFVLSGGIGLDQTDKLKNILATDLPILALDVNSRFESKPGLKNIEAIREFQLKTQFKEGNSTQTKKTSAKTEGL